MKSSKMLANQMSLNNVNAKGIWKVTKDLLGKKKKWHPIHYKLIEKLFHLKKLMYLKEQKKSLPRGKGGSQLNI